MKPATWSNVSNATNAQVEVKVPPGTPIDLKALCAVLDEGFKKHLMVGVNETSDMLESIEKAIMEHGTSVSQGAIGIMDLYKETNEQLNRIAGKMLSVGTSLDQVAKNIDSVEDSMPLIVNAIKSIKFDANIPITNLSVVLPRALVWYAIFAPVIFALLSLLIAKHP